MTYTLEDNEFTDLELLQYLNFTFGTSSRGKPFTTANLNIYCNQLCLPKLYGGNRVRWQRLSMLGNTRVWRIEELSRKMLTEPVMRWKPLNNRQKGALTRKKKSPVSSTKLLQNTLARLAEKSDSTK